MRQARRYDINWSKLFHVVVRRGMWARLSNKAKAVYPVLHAHIDDNTRNCWPSNVLLAQEAGLHEKSVPAATEELVRRKLIKKWRKDRKNFYHLYTEQELEDLLPFTMDVSQGPHKMDKSPLFKPRDAKGRFIHPLSKDEPLPCPTDTAPPYETALEAPSDLDTNKNPSRRNREKEVSNKNLPAGSASALAGAKASPAFPDERTTKPRDWLETTRRVVDNTSRSPNAG